VTDTARETERKRERERERERDRERKREREREKERGRRLLCGDLYSLELVCARRAQVALVMTEFIKEVHQMSPDFK
jgi:hypothetical protein